MKENLIDCLLYENKLIWNKIAATEPLTVFGHKDTALCLIQRAVIVL